MENETCTVSNIEKHINIFKQKKHSECKACNIKKRVKRYHDKRDKMSIQQKIYYEKTDLN